MEVTDSIINQKQYIHIFHVMLIEIKYDIQKPWTFSGKKENMDSNTQFILDYIACWLNLRESGRDQSNHWLWWSQHQQHLPSLICFWWDLLWVMTSNSLKPDKICSLVDVKFSNTHKNTKFFRHGILGWNLWCTWTMTLTSTFILTFVRGSLKEWSNTGIILHIFECVSLS